MSEDGKKQPKKFFKKTTEKVFKKEKTLRAQHTFYEKGDQQEPQKKYLNLLLEKYFDQSKWKVL